jgi:hypothetical protein
MPEWEILVSFLSFLGMVGSLPTVNKERLDILEGRIEKCDRYLTRHQQETMEQDNFAATTISVLKDILKQVDCPEAAKKLDEFLITQVRR